MADLRTEFLGLKLKSPVIAGSSGMTSDINHLIALEKAGVGAVILKSIFEEQINRETTASIGSGDAYPEAGDYIRNYIRANTLEEYVKLLKTAKSELGIPVIPSINCMTDGGWVDFARHLEDAGADAVEVNAFVLPVNPFRESADVESVYYRIIKHLKSEIKIPVLFKIGHNFTNLPMFVSKLKGYGADGVTIFNRFFEPDIDIDKMEVGGATVFTTSSDIRTTIRWTGILRSMAGNFDISASTGVHDGKSVVKLLLAGANTAQLCSVLYREGTDVVGKINGDIAAWMDAKGYRSIDEFRGKLAYSDIKNVDLYERSQFMKYFSNKKIDRL